MTTDIAKPGLSWEYADSKQTAEMVQIEGQIRSFHRREDGCPRSRKYLTTLNPATAEPLAKVAAGGKADVAHAVEAARNAYDKSWSKTPPAERAKYLFRIARLLQERSREFAVLETIDGGKPIKESRDVDLPLAAAHFFYYAGWADKLEYAFPGLTPKPLGVAGQIIPWNFPMLMLAWKVAPALATGNTVVLKPAETTPLTALAFAQLSKEAGLPDGVLNIVTGAGDTGSAIVNHPDINKIAFTGSTGVGKIIQRALAGTGKKLTLELGGKGAHIVFDDAALDQAIEGTINGIFFNQGHVCCAGSRLFVQENIYDVFLAKLKNGSTRCGWVIHSTRTPTSVPSTPPNSSSGSRRWWRPARPKVPRCTSPIAHCRGTGSISARRCSWECRSRIGSPRRRSLARCCR